MTDGGRDGFFTCLTFRCGITPEACASRHVARTDNRRGPSLPLYRDCDACALGVENASKHAPRAKLKRFASSRLKRSAGPVVAAEAKKLVEATKLPSVERERQASKRKDVPKAQRPVCSECRERRAGPIRNGTPEEHVGWCGKCRDRARKAASYQRKTPVQGDAYVSAEKCSKLCGREVGPVLTTTRPEDRDKCVKCRQRDRELRSQRAHPRPRKTSRRIGASNE